MTVLTNTSFRMAMMTKPTLPLFIMTLAAASNVTLRTVANTAGYTGGNAQITLATSADMFSTSAGTAAIVPGSWPAGVTVTLIIPSGTFITGAGGFGGNNITVPCCAGASHPGGPGGTALSALGISGFTFQVQNLGTIRGGGGGGGGGVTNSQTICCVQFVGGGSGGGGGQGHNGGIGGGGTQGGGNGSSGSVSAAGSAGTPGTSGCVTGFPGGNGGAFGSNGGAGPGSNTGGAAGNAVQGNANIVWIGPTGTRIGPVT